MGNADETHFEEYREQTRIKHEILAKYLPVYLTLLSKTHNNLLYLDAFAGRGTYLDKTKNAEVPGSPLLAMELVASDSKWSAAVQCAFVEQNKEHFQALDACVQKQQKAKPLVKSPEVIHGSCATLIDSLRKNFKGNLAPTFFFVDPCGVSGVKLCDLTEILRREWCEVFLFFNYEGVNRIAGNTELTGESPTLVDLLGSQVRVEELVKAIQSRSTPGARENAIVEAFFSALKNDSGAKFLLPFKIESEHRKSTSHYLVYATKHAIGFRIMKDIMWEAGKSSDSDEGGLHLRQSTGEYSGLFRRPDLDACESSIMKELELGRRNVGDFTTGWAERPDDLIASKAYRQCLIGLEQNQRVTILDKDGITPKPASNRRKYKGRVTLGDDYYIVKSAS